MLDRILTNNEARTWFRRYYLETWICRTAVSMRVPLRDLYRLTLVLEDAVADPQLEALRRVFLGTIPDHIWDSLHHWETDKVRPGHRSGHYQRRFSLDSPILDVDIWLFASVVSNLVWRSVCSGGQQR